MKLLYTTYLDDETGIITIKPAKGIDLRITAPENPFQFKKGDRVVNMEDSLWIKKGAIGTVIENAFAPNVIWDSEDMLTDKGKYDERKWAQSESNLTFLESKINFKEVTQ